jgi:hypothetical protein
MMRNKQDEESRHLLHFECLLIPNWHDVLHHDDK